MFASAFFTRKARHSIALVSQKHTPSKTFSRILQKTSVFCNNTNNGLLKETHSQKDQNPLTSVLLSDRNLVT